MTKDLSYILDIFGGSDGGVGFTRLRAFVDEQEDHPRVKKIVGDFANLIRACNGDRLSYDALKPAPGVDAVEEEQDSQNGK